MQLDDIVDSHSGKEGIVFAHGPSAKLHLSHLLEASRNKEKYCFIGLGELDAIQSNLGIEFTNDYWVMANHEMNILNSYPRFNRYPNTTLIWADSVDQSPLSSAMTLLKVPYISYDQRHFGNVPCPNCPVGCRVLHGRLTIQELVQHYTGYNEHYSTGSTVALHATALAILLGCNPVHIYGVDLNCRMGYVDDKTQARHPAVFDGDLPFIVNDFDILTKSAHNVGVKLVNHSSTSPLSAIMATE
jgi:hypothetical protein